MKPDKLVIAGREFSSRLLVGTGKYASFAQMVEAHEKSGAEIVTVAVRRVNLSDRSRESLLGLDRYRALLHPAQYGRVLQPGRGGAGCPARPGSRVFPTG